MTTGRKHRFTWSELRGIGLVAIALVALGFYYRWWFLNGFDSILSVLTFILALIYGLIQLVGNWLLYLATHYRSSNYSLITKQKVTVDVYITAYKEEHSLIERALTAALAMEGEKKVWLLDDGEEPALKQMAARLGAGYLVRPDRRDAKAGNLNAALPRTDGEIIVIFDIDHAPTPDFLTKTLGCFDDPKVGFAQVMLTFANRKESWITTATADTSLDFYNPTSIGADGMRSATLIGSNALIRRKALEDIGGYQPGLAEDLATSVALHAAGWNSVYVPEPLAPGISPPDLTAWFTQQFKWARGVFELFVTVLPKAFFKLRAGHRIMYTVRMTYYWVGLFVAAHLFSTIFVLIQGTDQALTSYQQYLWHLFPLLVATVSIRFLALRRWAHPSVEERTTQWKPTLLVFATWPIYTLAWFMAILRIPLRFHATPKTLSNGVHPLWVIVQFITIGLLIGGLVNAYLQTQTTYILVYGLASGQVLAQCFLIVDWFRPRPNPEPTVKSSTASAGLNLKN